MKEITLPHFFKLASELEVDGVEIMDQHFDSMSADYVKSLRRTAESFGLDLPVIDVCSNFLAPELFETEVKNVNKWIEIASRLECPILKIYFGIKPPEMSNWKAFELTKEGIKRILPVAETNNKIIGIEIHPTYPQDDPAAIVTLMKIFGSDNFRAIPDPSLCPPGLRYEALRLMIPYAVHFHAKCYEFNFLGNETTFDYEKIFSMMKELNFKGGISAEYGGAGFTAEQRMKGLRKMIALIRRNF